MAFELGALSRRAALQRTLVGTVAALGQNLFGRSVSSLQYPGSPQREMAPQRLGPCVQQSTATQQTLQFSAEDTVNGERVSLNLSTLVTFPNTVRSESHPDTSVTRSRAPGLQPVPQRPTVPGGPRQVHVPKQPILLPRKPTVNTKLSFMWAGSQFFDVDTKASDNGPHASESTVHFGPGITGLKQMSLQTSDGETFEGLIDDRRLVPFAKGSLASGIKFMDGGSLPAVKMRPGTQDALRAILGKAKLESQGCAPQLRSRRNVLRDSPDVSLVLTSFHPNPDPPPQIGGRSDNTSGTTGCLTCMGACVPAGIACAYAAATSVCGGFLPWNPPGYIICTIAAAAACASAEAWCMRTCHNTGAPCCPVGCGEVACCFGGDTCLDPSRGVCCPPNTAPCHNRSCCQPSDTCMADGSCCPQSQIVCGNTCCPPGDASNPMRCKNGICCPEKQNECFGVCCDLGGVCVNNTCCNPPNHICGGGCCPPLNACCNNVCCPGAEDKCINVACCPKERVCGSACCAAGQVCDQPTGSCKTMTCNSGTVTCIPTYANGSSASPICCAPGIKCCPGKCCGPGEMCCGTHGRPYGCYSEQICIP